MIRHFLLAILCATLLSGCLEIETDEVVPGEDFEIVDAYFDSSYSNLSYIVLVIKNNRSKELPSIHVDYNIVCDNGYKKYSTSYFYLDSHEQSTYEYYAGSSATSCTFTITAVRPYADDSYDDWTGSFSIQIP